MTYLRVRGRAYERPRVPVDDGAAPSDERRGRREQHDTGVEQSVHPSLALALEREGHLHVARRNLCSHPNARAREQAREPGTHRRKRKVGDEHEERVVREPAPWQTHKHPDANRHCAKTD